MEEYTLINFKVFNLKTYNVENAQNNDENKLTVANGIIVSKEKEEHDNFFIKSQVKVETTIGMAIEFDYTFFIGVKNKVSLQEIDDTFDNEKLNHVTYPYIRTFISSLCLILGFGNINLPFIIE
ncbi:TPA: hypothetical protein SLE56_001151 [Morganella morganii]|nr:hypothetical protein [Morganella morganii]